MLPLATFSFILATDQRSLIPPGTAKEIAEPPTRRFSFPQKVDVYQSQQLPIATCLLLPLANTSRYVDIIIFWVNYQVNQVYI